MKLLHRFPWIPFFLIFATLSLLGSLAHPLWGDEAETALFAQSILTHGVPYGWDGTNIMGIQDAIVLNKDLINYKSPWAQYYLAAASFAFLPDNSFTARLPFLLLGLSTIPLLYYFALGITQERRVALLSVVIASLSVPFILFSFQARYYSFIAVMALLLSLTSLQISEKKWWPKVAFTLAGIGFFYGNYMVFAAFYVALFVAFIIGFGLMYVQDRTKNIIKHARDFSFSYLGLGLIIAASSAPWFFILKPYVSEVQPAFVVYTSIFNSTAFYFLDAFFRFNDAGIFPLVFFPLWIVFLIKHYYTKEPFVPLLIPGLISFVFLLIMAILNSFVIVETQFISTRYTMVVIPFFILTAAYLIYDMIRWKAFIGYFVLFLLIFTTLFSLKAPRVLVAEYFSEVTNPYETPDTAVAEYLKTHAKKGDTAFVSIDRSHYPLMFHLGSKLSFVRTISVTNPQLFPENRGKLPLYLYTDMGEPDWIILYGTHTREGRLLNFDDRNIPKMANLQEDYEEVVLPIFAMDLSRPEIEGRSFVRIAPYPEEMVYIYKKKE